MTEEGGLGVERFSLACCCFQRPGVLNHGVKAKMCETTPYVNSVGTQYIAARANIELACDSVRDRGLPLALVRDGGCPPDLSNRSLLLLVLQPKGSATGA